MLQVTKTARVEDFYKFRQNLGEGNSATVKLSEHKKTGKKVAIKVVERAQMKPVDVLQMRREIDVLKMCQHPNLIKLLDYFETITHYYIVLDYMAGGDLYDYLNKRGFRLPENRAKEIARQLVQGTKYLHRMGVIHRDLKLENVLMTDNTDKSVPVIVDFGLSKILGPSDGACEPYGTVGYVAPEVHRKEPYSFSCDVWSLGCIFYAMISGSLPFDSEVQEEAIRMALEDELEFEQNVW